MWGHSGSTDKVGTKQEILRAQPKEPKEEKENSTECKAIH